VALAYVLATMAGRLEPAEALRVSRLLGELLIRSLETNWTGLGWSPEMSLLRAQGLILIAGRLAPDEGARMLIAALEKETELPAYQELARGLSVVAERLDPGKLQEMCSPLLEYTLRRRWFGFVANLLPLVDSEKAALYANRLARWICSGSVPGMGVDALLTRANPQEVNRRAATTTAAIGLASSGPLAALAALRLTSDPLPCWLSTQDLVDLLKMPTCFGENRQIVLRHLGNRYGRTFADHWEFVRFAQEQGLDLDLTSPPKRPARP
jgi:hypothetical protein